MRKTQLKSTTQLKRGTSTLKSTTRLRHSRKAPDIKYQDDQLWSSTKADNMFSKFILERDGICQRCGTKQQGTCSHFGGRDNSATRYDPDNCIRLCLPCHSLWEYEKTKGKEYYNFMLYKLGPDEFLLLQQRINQIQSRTEAIKNCMDLLRDYKPMPEIKF